MRAALIAIVTTVTAGAALASPPYANELMLPAGGAKAAHAETAVPQVARGQFLGLSCAAVERAAKDTVRVVMSFVAGGTETGYAGVLATDQTISGRTVHVRVPDLPDLAEHTMSVRIYVADHDGLHSCDAGRVRIV